MDNRKPRRARRTSSPAVIERLERSRNRIRERRAAAAKRERIVVAAVEEYIRAWHAITTAEQARDDQIAALEQQINTVREHAASEVAAQRRHQALAAAMIRQQGHRDDDVADLLEITPKEVRQLIASANTTTSRTTEPSTRKPDGSATSQDISPSDGRSSTGEEPTAKLQAALGSPAKVRTESRSEPSASVDSTRPMAQPDRPV